MNPYQIFRATAPQMESKLTDFEDIEDEAIRLIERAGQRFDLDAWTYADLDDAAREYLDADFRTELGWGQR